MAANHFALLTDLLDAWAYFHCVCSFRLVSQEHRSGLLVLRPTLPSMGSILLIERSLVFSCGVAVLCYVLRVAVTGYRWVLLVPISDTTTGEVIGRQLNLDAITGENADVMHTHFSGNMGQYFVAVFEFHAEHCVRQWLSYRSFQNDRVFFWLRQNNVSCVSDQKTPAQDCANAGTQARADLRPYRSRPQSPNAEFRGPKGVGFPPLTGGSESLAHQGQ